KGTAKKSGKEEKKEKDKDADKENTLDMPRELLAAADRFQIADLQLLCSAKLAESITTDNAAELLMLADACHANDLKVTCFFVYSFLNRTLQRCLFEFLRADTSRVTEVMDTRRCTSSWRCWRHRARNDLATVRSSCIGLGFLNRMALQRARAA